MSTAAVIVLGILTWVLVSILLSLFLARLNSLNRPRVSAVEPSLTPPVGKPALNPTVEALDRFPAQPARFVGRAETIAGFPAQPRGLSAVPR